MQYLELWNEGRKKGEGRVAMLSLCVGLTLLRVRSYQKIFYGCFVDCGCGRGNLSEDKRRSGPERELCRLGRTSARGLGYFQML